MAYGTPVPLCNCNCNFNAAGVKASAARWIVAPRATPAILLYSVLPTEFMCSLRPVERREFVVLVQ